MIVDTPNKLISLTNTLNILFNTEKKIGVKRLCIYCFAWLYW